MPPAAVWIVAEPRPEHVSVIAWLNESSSADFYLVKVEAVRALGALQQQVATATDAVSLADLGHRAAK